ncbi:MAG TPA: hypothetical protein VEA58_06380 [Anaerovoracaceae bacterium]|nr:hypothetical protein [Anaerovoracaceae bacterium]
MITKRSKFWTIVFAFLPGAGHMYNGFMKLGVSFMGLFFGLWMVASVINIGPLAFLAPVIWFYAFFDCVNKIFQNDDEFYMQEDHYLFTREQLESMNIHIFKERNLLIGGILILIGIYALWNNVVLHILSSYDLLSPAVYQAIVNFGNIIPQLVVGSLIVWAGIALIMGKKKEIEVKAVGEVLKEEVKTDDYEK